MAFVSDTFTDTSGTDLTAHTGGTGATWTKHTSYSTGKIVVSNANRARNNTSNTSVYYASGSPAGAQYDVSADLRYVATSATNLGVAGRINTAADTMYIWRHNGSGSWQLIKINGGSSTTLASFSQTLATSTTYAIKLEIRTATKKGYVDGVERASSTDDQITAAGKAGIYASASASDSAGYHLDNFDASDYSPPPHSDSHTDTAHSDVAHSDSAHSDTAHSDTAHSDAAHSDSAHSDTAHSDTAHADSHSDVAHSDTHTDSTHSDSHSDAAHSDSAHADSHSDTAHTDSHSDVAHSDVAHADSHSDTAHSDSHSDDTGHTDSHADSGHSDSHSDTAHSDQHSDIAHSDGTYT